MLGYLDFLFLGYSGRIGRLTFWMAFFALGLIELIAMVLLVIATSDMWTAGNPPDPDEFMRRIVWPMLIIVGIFMWPTYALYTKRWHDRDKSGWWSLIAFVPFIGGLWMTVELGFLGGTDGTNAYGYR